jgi:hypothetical protein
MFRVLMLDPSIYSSFLREVRIDHACENLSFSHGLSNFPYSSAMCVIGSKSGCYSLKLNKNDW